MSTQTQHQHTSSLMIFMLQKSSPVLRAPQFLIFGIGNLLVDPLLLKMSPLSRASNQCACLLSKSDYTRSALWLQLTTRHCLLICAPNTETGKSQGSYQGYLGDLWGHCPIPSPFCNQCSYLWSFEHLLDVEYEGPLFWGNLALASQKN